MSRRNLLLAAQAIVTMALLVMLFRRFDWARFAEVASGMSVQFYAGSLLAVLAGQVLYAWRWRVVMLAMGLDLPFGLLLRQYFVGIFFSTLMPTAVGGDAAKVYYLGRQSGYVQVGASVFVDRVVGFLWLSVIGAGIAWIVPATDAVQVLSRQLLTFFAVGFVTAMLVAWFVPVEALLPRLVPERWRAKVAGVAEFVAIVRHGLRSPSMLAIAAFVTGGYACLVTLVYLQHFAANGLPAVGLLPAMVAIISVSIFVNVPITVGGIGLREQLHVMLFAALGVPTEVAVTISLLLFSHTLVMSLIGCGLWFKARPVAVAA